MVPLVKTLIIYQSAGREFPPDCSDTLTVCQLSLRVIVICFDSKAETDPVQKLFNLRSFTLLCSEVTCALTACALCIGACVVGTHIFILSSEMWSCGLVQSHDHSHQVFAVEDGRSQNVSGLVICEFIDE